MSTRSFRKMALVTGILFIALLALGSSQVGAETPTIISTTFTSEEVIGIFDEELQSIIGKENGWIVQMTNPRLERSPCYDSSYCESCPSDPDCWWYLVVDSFTFTFTGPDADLLNDRVGQYLVEGWAGRSWTDLGLMGIEEQPPPTSWVFRFYVGPPDENQIRFSTDSWGSCQTDPDGTPILDGLVLDPVHTCFHDTRPGHAGNLQGDTGSMSMYFQIKQMAEELINDVVSLNLQQGISNSLDAKLESALQALDDVNENNDVAAINSLNAFINAVEAQRGNKIPEADADAIIAEANAIIAGLQAP